jgi:hypothetical protein
MKKNLAARPQQVTELTKVQCFGCGWEGILAEAAQSIYIDLRPAYQIPASQGGNGKNWRCPLCKELIFYTRSDHTRKDIAPQGHSYRSVI